MAGKTEIGGETMPGQDHYQRLGKMMAHTILFAFFHPYNTFADNSFR